MRERLVTLCGHRWPEEGEPGAVGVRGGLSCELMTEKGERYHQGEEGRLLG